MIIKTREAAFLAILASVKDVEYACKSLQKWREHDNPPSRDFNFAQELAFGTIRMAMALDHIGLNLSDNKKLNLKLKEKVLLRMAIYQFIFMDRVPIYAITNEATELAKQYCHGSFVKFLNAILRNLSKENYFLPEDKFSIRYSYPEYYVEHLLKDYGQEITESLLEIGNKSGCTMFRNRKTGVVETVTDVSIIPEIAQSSDYYIQNATPAALIDRLCEGIEPPKNVLDLCASPGGKLISIHDHFPNAKLHANDVSDEKLIPLAENCQKYGIQTELSCSKGEEYRNETKFDLIILDVPCSNSGVLNKRPEARWRLSHENVKRLEKTQLDLIENALTLLSNRGEIWYLTCSILKRENERLMEKIPNVRIRLKETILPNHEGWDGGFACALQKL